VSQEICARLQEGVSYVKVYRCNPKHLCPKLNGYGDNGSTTRGHLQATHLQKIQCSVYFVNNTLKVRRFNIIHYDVIECLFFLSVVLRPLCFPLGVPLCWLCVACADLCSPIWLKHVAHKHRLWIFS
jgi:hypothetical protein